MEVTYPTPDPSPYRGGERLRAMAFSAGATSGKKNSREIFSQEGLPEKFLT